MALSRLAALLCERGELTHVNIHRQATPERETGSAPAAALHTRTHTQKDTHTHTHTAARMHTQCVWGCAAREEGLSLRHS